MEQSIDTNNKRLRWPLMCVLFLVALVALPTVLKDLSRDDYIHKAYLTGQPMYPVAQAGSGLAKESNAPGMLEAINGMFSFSGMNGEILDEAAQWGAVPWWVAEDIQLNFWRPISAFTHWVDYQLWPDSPAAMHFQNVSWYLFVLFLLALLLKRSAVAVPIIVLTIALYGLDVSHSLAISWIANRNIFVVTSMVLMALMCFHFWRGESRDGRNSIGAIVGFWVFLALALLSAEAGVAILAFVAAYLLILDRGKWIHRTIIGGLVLVVVVVWRLIYRYLGYGAANNGAYVDPLAQPGAFLQNVATNAPTLLFDQMIGVDTYVALMSPETFQLQVIIAWVGLVLFTLLFLPLLRADRDARYWYVASWIAVVPSCAATLSSGRLMFLAGIGLMVVLAKFLHGLIKKSDWLPESKLYRGFAWVFTVIFLLGHVAGNGVGWFLTIQSQLSDRPIMSALQKPAEVEPSPEIAQVFVNTPLQFEMLYVPSIANAHGKNIAKAIHTLAPAWESMRVTRVSDNSIELESLSDIGFPLASSLGISESTKKQHMTYLYKKADGFFIDSDTEFHRGQFFQQGDMGVEVLAVSPEHMPTKIKAIWPYPLSSKKLQWFTWDWESKRYDSWPVLAVGESQVLKGPF